MMATRQIVPIVIALISVMLSACVDAGEKKERPTGPAFPVDGKAMAEVIEHARNELMQSSSVTVRADNLRLDVQLKAVADLPFAGSDDRSVRHDGFWGDLQPGGIRLYATERIALFYALDELQEMLSERTRMLPSGQFFSWADHEVRALHLVMRKLSEAEARALIDQARQTRFNTLILQLSDAVRFDNDVIRYRDDAISKSAFVRIIDYARDQGFDVVPGIQLLTHQEHFFKSRYPQLMYNSSTYDPRNAETMRLVAAYLQEVIDTIKPDAIHIGHDEVAGLTEKTRKKWLRPEESALPPELFLQHVIDIQRLLSEQDLETWMWGDMLSTHQEFPTMHAADFNGLGGYADLRGRLPASVVICDWHYYQRRGPFLTAAAHAAEGHPVLGTTWKSPANIVAFSKYMADLPGSRGMIASTWFHVQRRERDVVNDIIETSGKRFWNAR